MSVVVVVRLPVKASEVSKQAEGDNAERLVRVSQDGKSKGAVHHLFAEDADGNAVVFDEWESEEAFHNFFDSQDEIRQIMTDAGASGPPEVTAYRIIDTPDRF